MHIINSWFFHVAAVKDISDFFVHPKVFRRKEMKFENISGLYEIIIDENKDLFASTRIFVNCSKIFAQRFIEYDTKLNVFGALLSTGNASRANVTLTTQFTPSRLHVFQRILKNWPGTLRSWSKQSKKPIFVPGNAANRCFVRCQTTKVPRNNKGTMGIPTLWNSALRANRKN